MIRFINLAAVVILMGVISAFGQQQPIQEIKPVVTAGDLVFAAQLLNTVELRGNEVEAFMNVKNAIKPFLEKVQNDKMQASSTLEMKISVTLANNFLAFLERGKIAGADAERYKRFVDAFVAAAKAASGQK